MYRLPSIAGLFLILRRPLLPRLALIPLLALAILATPAAAEPYRFDGVEKVVAFGDVHGAYPELVGLLREAGVIDAELRWSGGRAHLVSTGDLFDRGDGERQVVELLMRLESEAEAAGGAVHVLLGNHEVMMLTGDLRYVTPGGFAAFDDGSEPASQPPGHRQRLRALAPDGSIGHWLLQRPVMIVIDGDLFVHGGLSAALQGKTLEQINREALRDVRAFATGWHALIAAGALPETADFDAIVATARRLTAERGSESESENLSEGEDALRAAAQAIMDAVRGLPFQPEGPVWYRGNSVCHPFVELAGVESLLTGLGADRVIIGHTPTLDRRISSRLDGRVLRMDTGMNAAAYQGRPAALFIENGRASALYAGEGSAELVVEPSRVWARPYGMSDAELEEFLTNAPIVQSEKLSEGVTHPRRLTLERDGRRLRAVFKTLDTDPRMEIGPWRKSYDDADRFVYELVAYRLDRILGFEMVPVTVLRTVEGKHGAVQYWVEDSVTDTNRKLQQIPYDGECNLALQYNSMNVFDLLIQNTDRNTGNILYDRDWQLWLIDHNRTFGSRSRPPQYLRKTRIILDAPLAAALGKVTEENLEPLSPYLHTRQIQALIRRAQSLRDRP